MIDKKVLDDVGDTVAGAKAIKVVLERLYYHPEFGTVRTRPIISMLITGAQYLADNLEVLGNIYREKSSADQA